MQPAPMVEQNNGPNLGGRLLGFVSNVAPALVCGPPHLSPPNSQGVLNSPDNLTLFKVPLLKKVQHYRVLKGAGLMGVGS